jgi:hypothetical protein
MPADEYDTGELGRLGSAWARFSRRQLLHRGAVAVGGLAGLGLLDPRAAIAWRLGEPRPIPGGLDAEFNLVPSDPFIHVLPPGIGFEMSTITDLNGVVGAAEVRGTARGDDGTSYSFDADMRFMRGVYVALDGHRRHAAFGFV